MTLPLTAGSFATADKLNGPICAIRQGSAQNLANNTFTVLTFGTEEIDTHAMHSTGVNPSRITAVREGYHTFVGGVGLVANATGARGGNWLKNGANVGRGQTMIGNAGASVSSLVPMRTITLYLVIGDYVELQGFQSSGGTLATSVAGTEESHIDVFFRR